VAGGESDPERRARRGGDHAALDQALQIDRHVESRLAQMTVERDQGPAGFGDSARRAGAAPGARVDRHDLAQRGIALEYHGLSALGDPDQARLGQRVVQGRGDRERVHDVADRGELDERDVHRNRSTI
jgi:hypothetical protein